MDAVDAVHIPGIKIQHKRWQPSRRPRKREFISQLTRCSAVSLTSSPRPDPHGLATLDYAAMSADLHPPSSSIPGDSKRCMRYSLDNLRLHEHQELPLLVNVSPTSMEADFVVYNCTLSSMTSKKTWTVSYWYCEFDASRTKLEEKWTFHDPDSRADCPGSCQALRDVVSVYFPKKRLPIMSSSQGAITSRKRKFELVLIHLLRRVLLPGSAMRCLHARRNLPGGLFEFL